MKFTNTLEFNIAKGRISKNWKTNLPGSTDYKLDQIIKNNDERKMTAKSFAEMVCSPSGFKASAARELRHMRANRIALAQMGKDPHSCDLVYLARAASFRKWAMLYTGKGV